MELQRLEHAPRSGGLVKGFGKFLSQLKHVRHLEARTRVRQRHAALQIARQCLARRSEGGEREKMGGGPLPT